MKHLLIEKFNELNLILDRFFNSNYNRSSTPEISFKDDAQVFNFACKIYKRGFLLLQDNLEKLPNNEAHILSVHEFKIVLNNISLEYDNRIFFLVDENFIKYHSLIKNYYSYLPTEETKNLNTVKNILLAIPENTKLIFAMGGGVTLDIAGFVASLLQLPVYYLATTLLSAVDASIGGKTGVNFLPYGKNQIGLFYEPQLIYFVPEFLSSLSHEEKVGGIVEAAKHAYLFGEFATDVLFLEKIYANTINDNELIYIINKNFNYKSIVVQLDPKERNGIRCCLNLGHTLAHILEALAEKAIIEKISHGIAVAHGIKFLQDFKLLEMPNDFYNFIHKITLQNPIIIKNYLDINIIIKLLSQDKKNSHQNFCILSLPQYGLFNLTKNNIDDFIEAHITEQMPTQEVSQWILKFIENKFTP